MTSTAGPEPQEPEEPGQSGTPASGPPVSGTSAVGGLPAAAAAPTGPVAAASSAPRYPMVVPVKALAGNLTFQDTRFLDDADCVEALESLAALKAWADAQTARTIDRLRDINHAQLTGPGRPGGEILIDTVTATDTALALRIPERTAARLVAEAWTLTRHHHRTLDALENGKINYRHVSIIIDETLSLPDGTPSEAFETTLLEYAQDHAPSTLARRARTLREKVHPETITTRHARCMADRRIELVPGHDGMAWLNAYLPADHAHAIYHRLTAHARILKSSASTGTRSGALSAAVSGASSDAGPEPRPEADRRTLAQFRTDIFSDLLTHWCGHDASTDDTGIDITDSTDARTLPGKGIRAEILITVSAAALTGATSDPADLEGYGPIPIETARQAAAGAPTWGRLLTDPVSGTALALDRTRYTPTKAMRTWLRVRDQTCTFPGCQRAAGACEVDHTVPWSRGGPTDHTNLATICRKHHMLKSHGITHATQPEPGTINWTSPAGKTYQTTPDPPPF